MLYVIGNAAHAPWLLSLDPYSSLERAERAIYWQRVGQGQFDPPEYWRTVTARELAQILPTMDRAPYTQKAWDGFLTSFTWENSK